MLQTRRTFALAMLVCALGAPLNALAIQAYKVGPGDVLRVAVYMEADLSGSYPVSARGYLELPLVGEIEVAGLDTDEIARRLTGTLANGFLLKPQVTVQVEKYLSQAVQVLGAVRKPGQYYLRGTTMLLDLLSEAGGVYLERSSSEVQVKRARTGEIEPFVLNLDQLLASGEGNIEVRAGDIVYVPENRVVYVMGLVGKPGPINWQDGLTVTQAISAAGGPEKTAKLQKVKILREGGHTIEVNVKRILKGRDVDIPVQAGDKIILEESPF